jgi:electron transfer flavoprotein beta subunit
MANGLETGSKLNQIVVAVKQVPDTTQVKIDPEKGTLIREGIPFIVNPFDAHAVEEALRLKDKYDCKVTAITMGPPNSMITLKKCLALGVDHAFLISDRQYAGADTLATSYVLAEAIKKIEQELGRVDLVICGKQTIDGDTAQVGPGIATRLNLSQLTLVDRILEVNVQRGDIKVRRKLEGRKEIVQALLPAMLSLTREINQPRYPTVPNRLEAEQVQSPTWDNSQLKLLPERIGMKGSPTNVKRIFSPERAKGEILGDGEKDPQGAVRLLIDKLIKKGLISI